ncbi:MAG: thiamine phosphate synthase [Bryobacteraceae bacterium]
MKLPRLYPILDVDLLERRKCPIEDAADGMARAGAEILQWRCKRPPSRDDVAVAERIAEICYRFHAQFVVNDRADLAMMLGAGLHLGQDDLPPAKVRKLMPNTAIGFSTHNARQLISAQLEPVDYLAIGPIFATVSKEKADPEVGIDRLREWRPSSALPVVAIGGITRQSARDVLEAGADSVAVISDLIPVNATRDTIRRRMEEWLTLLNT